MKKNYILSIIAFMLVAVSYINAQTYEAESGANSNVLTKAETNASNGSVAYSFSALGQNKITGVNGGAGGSGTVLIRYSNGDATSKTLNFWDYLADGSTTTDRVAVTFPPTGSWTNFAVVAVPYTMTFLAGNVPGNNFKLRNNSGSTVAIEIDKYTISVTGAYVAVSSIAVNPTTTTVNAGATTSLTATFTPSNATNQTVAWSSSDPTKATVSSTGVVTGVSAGSVTITATSQNEAKTASSSITVTAINVPVTGVSVSPSSANIGVGATSTLSATITPSDASNKTVNWSTSNAAVATVSGGVVTGVAVGTATITATTQDGSFTSSSSITVTTIPVTGVTVSPSTATVVAGAYIPLTATIAPVTASNKTVSWSSSNNAVAKVSASGVVTGMSAGSAIITATSQDGSFTSASSVTVNAAAANYALNPDFELNAPAASPTNWFEWTGSANNYIVNSSVVAGNSGLGNAVGGTPHSGSYYIAIAPTVTWPTTFDVLNKQDLTGLPNGTYTLKAWFRGNGGSGYLNVGSVYNSFNFTNMSQWTQYTINNINVTNGTVTINIQFNSTTGTELDIDDVQLTLNQFVLVTGINSVTPASKTLSINETTTLTTTTIPANASNSTINWSSSNTAVATVSAAGVVTAVSAGIATITATSSEGGYTATAAITVQPNYVLNPGFEANGTAVALASSWAEWSATSAYTDNSNVITGNVGLGDAVGGAPHSGSYYLEVAPTGANPTTYGVLNFQSIANIPNDTYVLSGWFRGNGGSGYLNVGAAYNNFNFVNLAQWTHLIIDNVVISTGTCQIQVNYTADNGQKLDIDDVQLTPKSVFTSTEFVAKNSNISIFPSLITNNILNIENTVKGNYEVAIINIDGQLMYSNKLSYGNFSINTSFLKSGLYLVRVSNGTEYRIQKVLIQ